MPSPEKNPTDPSSGTNPGGKCDATVATCPKMPTIPKECAFLNKGHLVSGTEKQFDRGRKPAVVGPGKDIKHTFPGDTAPSDATEYEVEVDGRKVKVIVPKPYPPGKNLPSVEEIAKGLGAVPSGQLATIKEVVVSPNPNPSDAYWAEKYKKPGFRSAATGGASGVTMYPTTNKLDQSRVDSNLIHEGGHTYASDLWKDAAKKEAWEKAMKSDPFSPSTYADSSADEDLAESMVMYSLSKGTKCEAIAKQMFPERYKILDQLAGK
jgi:hypothetical protein